MLQAVGATIYERGGAKLHIQTLGLGPAMVLIHGLSGSARWWKANTPALAREHTVYVIELSGYGAARRQRALGVREAAQLIAAWLSDLNLQGVTLIGHSMGGQISLHVAALVPQRVENLVLACASGLLRSNLYLTALNLPKAALRARKTFLPQIAFDALRAGPLNLWSSTHNLLKDNVHELLPQIKARTLVIWGERDPLVPVALGRSLAQEIPGAQLAVIPRAGHVVMVDAPHQFNDLVLNFVQHAEVTS